jgi:hypothetical protein
LGGSYPEKSKWRPDWSNIECASPAPSDGNACSIQQYRRNARCQELYNSTKEDGAPPPSAGATPRKKVNMKLNKQKLKRARAARVSWGMTPA